VHAPELDHDQAASNVVRFLVRERADLYLEERLRSGELSARRERRALRLYEQLDDKLARCEANWKRCRYRKGKRKLVRKKSNYQLFREIYLSDFDGVKTVAFASIRRIGQNFEQAETFKRRYNLRERGHMLFAQASFLFLIGGFFFLGWFGLRRWTLARRKEPDDDEGAERAALGFAVGALLAAFALLAFLGVGGGIREMPRNEAPGVWALALIVGVCVGLWVDLRRGRAER
jgi:hypothetical protein